MEKVVKENPRPNCLQSPASLGLLVAAYKRLNVYWIMQIRLKERIRLWAFMAFMTIGP
jgi:hypothetical protein